MCFGDNTICAGGLVNTYPTKILSFGEDEAGMAKLRGWGSLLGGGGALYDNTVWAGGLVNNNPKKILSFGEDEAGMAK